MIRRGRLTRRDVEGGTWVLHTAGGDLVLLGDVPRALDGAEVEVEGDDAPSFGFAMAGPQFDVRRIRAIDRG